MRRILVWLLLFCVSSALAQTPDQFLGEDGILTKAEIDEGWIALFDGETLFGWRPQPAANFRVEDRTITVDKGAQCLLCTTTQFSDYVLKIDFRCDEDTNSGIFLRTPPKPQDVATDCYELNIAPPDNAFPTGSFVKLKKHEGHVPNGNGINTKSRSMVTNRRCCLMELKFWSTSNRVPSVAGLLVCSSIKAEFSFAISS